MAQHTLRLPDPLHQQLSNLAAERSVSVNQLVTTLVERAVDDHYVNRAFVDHCAQRTIHPTVTPTTWELTTATMLDAARACLPNTPVAWRNKAALTPTLNQVNDLLRHNHPHSTVRAAGLLLAGCASFFPFTENNAGVGIRTALALMNVYRLATIAPRDTDLASLRALARAATHAGEPEPAVVDTISRDLTNLLASPLPDCF